MTYNPNDITALIRGTYDLQKLRIQMGNRICTQFKAKLGQPPGVSEEESLEEDSMQVLDTLRDEFRKLMDGVKTVKLATFKATPIISTYTEFALLQQYLDLEETEARHFKHVEKLLPTVPVYEKFLSQVKGCGAQMSGVIISEIDIAKAKYPSSLWQFAGCGVESDGRGTSRRKEHMHKIIYKDKDGKEQERNGIRYNPWLKTKLLGVLGPCMLKAGMVKKKENGENIKGLDGKDVIDFDRCTKYVQIYLNYKHRMESHPKWGVQNDAVKVQRDVQAKRKPGEQPATETKLVSLASPGHRHAMANRYMIKRFLCDLYNVWRPLAGLPVAPEYNEAKLGHVHKAS